MSLIKTPLLQSMDASDRPDLSVRDLGPIAIIAPHPDDETLGCGGLIAYCARLQVPVTVVAMTDGESSHPGSRQTSPEQLVEWRFEERAKALTALGAHAARVECLHLPDGGMARLSPTDREQCVRSLVAMVRRHRIRTVFVTASDDDHPDHQASYALVEHVLDQIPTLRILTYAVWPANGVIAGGVRWALDIEAVHALKKQAIACFSSQRGEVITDDSAGFAMPEALLTRALASHELYYPGPGQAWRD